MNCRAAGLPRPASVAAGLVAALLALTLQGCGPTPEPVPPPPSSPAQGTGEVAPDQLQPLSASDVTAAALAGELACSFASGAAPLLYATGLVASSEPAQGIVKRAGMLERLAAPGGFDAMVGDVTFSGKDSSVSVRITGPATAGGESPALPATLRDVRADGSEAVHVGHWQCGP